MDSTAPEDEAAAQDEGKSGAAPAEKGKRKVAAKAGVKMCQVCMVSVAEDQLTEQDGQKVCPTCAESMRNKAAKKTAPPEKK